MINAFNKAKEKNMSTGTTSSRANVELEAAFANWGLGQCRKTSFVDDTTGSLTDEYFDLNVVDFEGVETKYYVLLSGTTPAVDPLISGKTKLELVYTDDDTKEELAVLYKALLATVGVFAKNNLDGSVQVENWYNGSVTLEGAVSPSLTHLVLQEGLGGYLGATSEALSVSFNTETVVLKGNQFGAIKIGESFVGSDMSVASSFLEVDPALKQTLFSGIGDTIDNAGNVFTGFGESKLFKNLDDFSGRLILHPIRLPNTDRSEDFCLWRSVPKPEEIGYDGENARSMKCSFSAFLSSVKDKKINLGGFGDWTEEGLNA